MSADELKELGNKAFGQGDFAAAEEHYTKGIEINSKAEALFSNRAATRLKLGRPIDALSDAEECIKINPAFMKGYHRKALAHSVMGDETAVFETYEACAKACAADE